LLFDAHAGPPWCQIATEVRFQREFRISIEE
jgi:hypothetical protein